MGRDDHEIKPTLFRRKAAPGSRGCLPRFSFVKHALILSLFGPAPLWGKCPDWLKDETLVPACPAHGFLGDEYPALGYVLSDAAPDLGTSVGILDQTRIVETARKILAFAGKRPPLVFLNVDKATFEAVKKSVVELAGPDAEGAKRLESSLRWISDQEVTPNRWIQDSFQTFNDPATGKVRMRPVADYRSHELAQTKKLLAALTKECPEMETGPGLKTFATQSCRGGECGGNIEFIPHTGLCLRGDSQKSGYAREYCSPRDEIVIPSKWLHVGHVDEYVATHPLPGSPCGVILSIASYAKAIALLEADRKGPLFQNDFPPGAVALAGDSASLLRLRNEQLKEGRQPLGTFCRQFVDKTVPDAPTGASNAAEHEIPGAARATAVRKPRLCTDATNGDLLAYLRSPGSGDPTLDARNQTLDKIFQEAAQTLKAKLKDRLGPKCPVELVELPQIFSDKTAALSLFPNPSNGVYVEGHLLLPDPVNPAFKASIEKSYTKLGLKPSFVGTFDTLHNNDGNLHCASQTLRYCRGNGKAPPAHSPGPPETDDDIPFEFDLDNPKELERLLSGKPESHLTALQRLNASLRGATVGKELARRILPLVEKILTSGSAEVRAEGFQVLGRLGAHAKAPLADWFAKGTGEVRRALLEGLRHAPDGDKFGLPGLARQGLVDKDPAVTVAALGLVIEAKLGRDDLAPLTIHADPKVRRLAFQRITEFSNLTTELGERGLNDADPAVQTTTAFALNGLSDSAEAKRLIRKALTSPDAAVRGGAYSSALRVYKDPNPWIRDALDDKSEQVGKILLYQAIDLIGGRTASSATALALAHSNAAHHDRALEYFFGNGGLTDEDYAHAFDATTAAGKKLMLERTSAAHFGSLALGLKHKDPPLPLAALRRAIRLNAKNGSQFGSETRVAVLAAAKASGLSPKQASALTERLCLKPSEP